MYCWFFTFQFYPFSWWMQTFSRKKSDHAGQTLFLLYSMFLEICILVWCDFEEVLECHDILFFEELEGIVFDAKIGSES